ncbi:MAG: ABC transporter permease [Gemmatimonadetes bacterium]|nr:ABC transporter permease [Gemmatimonadota bacterium]
MLPALRTAVRSLRATPLVTGVAVLSLALGIGANTAIFSIVDALILKALPVQHAERLTVVRAGESRRSWTNPIWEQVRERQHLWDGAFAAGAARFDAAEGGQTDPVDGAFVSGGYFEVLGVQPRLGRFFTPDDDRRGGGADGPVVVISHRLWQQRFGGAPDVVGRTFTLSRVSYTIIGVAPASFLGHDVGRNVDAYVPIGTEPLVRGPDSGLDRRSHWWMAIFVRLRPDQTPEVATAILRGVQTQIREATLPQDWRAEMLERYLVDPFELQRASAGVSQLRTRYQRPLFALAAVVGLTLLIACGNIANLMLARASARRHDFAVRTALGASRWRIARQLLTENLVLSLLGAALGLLLALWFSRLIIAQIATTASQVTLDLGLDARMLAFTGGVAILTTLLFGVGPSVLAARTPPMDALKEQGRGTTSGTQRAVANALVVAQVTLSLLLVVGAGLFVRTFVALADVDLGFVPARALVVELGAQRTGVAPEARGQMYENVRQAALAVPGVTHAAFSVITPVSGSTWNGDLVFPRKPDLTEEERIVDFNYVTPGWFATYGTRILRGRDFDARDRPGTPRVALVNESFVRKYFDGVDPIGEVVSPVGLPTSPGAPIEIIGVVADAVYRSPREPFGPTMYRALEQNATAASGTTMTIRTTSDQPAALQRALTAAIASVHPDLSVTYRPLEEFVEAALAQERLIAMLSGFFGALALLLAAIGLYGITAYSVVRRRAEIGIRLALGATPGGVVRGVLSRTGMLVAGGILLGGVASWWASRFVSSLLFGLAPTDPVTIAGAMLVLAAVSAVAGWIPARRAARVEPAEALRSS